MTGKQAGTETETTGSVIAEGVRGKSKRIGIKLADIASMSFI